MSNPEVLNMQSRDEQHAVSLLTQDHNSQPERWVDALEVNVESNHFSQLHVSELLVGHQDSAEEWFDNMVDQVKQLPASQKPDLIVAGAFVLGPFKHKQKERRVTVRNGLETLDSQLELARAKIDKLLEIGSPVVYNMGPDDHRIAEDYTIEYFRKIMRLGKNLGVDQVNAIKGHSKYQHHLDFQNRVVYPYMLHAGRRLKTVDELPAQDGIVNESEYFTLWNANQRRLEGKQPTRRQQKLLDMRAFNSKDFIITDDVDLITETDTKRYKDKIRAYMGFSPEPQYQDALKPAVNHIQDQMTNGLDVADGYMLQHNHEFVAMSFGETWLTSNGSGIDARNYMNTRGHKSDARGDISRRLNTTRRRVHPPMAHMIDRSDDGSTTFTLLNDALMEKSDSLDRTEVLFTCDHQVGSITARPDILLKEIDLFRERLQRVGNVAIQFAGDMSHGRNYPDFPSESQSTRLMSMDSQLRFNEELWKGAFNDMEREEWDAVYSVLIQPGNHEWNSGTDKWHGYSFVDNHRLAFEVMMASAGYTSEEIKAKVKTHDAVTTPNGEVAKAFTGIENYGDYRTLNQHYLLARGGKGSGGSSPIYQASDYMKGMSDLGENIDLLGAGHWHHGSCACFGNKAAWVAPAKAGLSGYELWRGYRPSIGSMILKLGGGLPVQLEFISERALHDHEIKNGAYSKESLKEQGYTDDPGHNPYAHGLRGSRKIPRSALQKAVIDLEDDISNRVDTMAYL